MSFIWNGVSSDTMKFNVTSRQVYNAPAYDLNAIEVPGRSGDLLNPQNRFKNKQVSYTGFLKASDFEGSTWWEKLSTGLIQLKGWLCSDAGQYHELTDDYDPGFTRYGYISGETAISDVQDRPFGVTLTVTFNCKPFMYKAGEPMELPETKSASGSIITITDGAENTPLKSCVVNIEPVQDLHGYDSPWPAGGGKNLYPIPCVEATYTNGGLTFRRNANGTITIGAGTATARIDLDVLAFVYGSGANTFSLPAGTYTISATGITVSGIEYIFGGSGGTSGLVYMSIRSETSTSSTNTISEGTTGYNLLQIASGTVISSPVTIAIQWEKGSSATAYSPYENICPISGWTQVKVTRAGANLLPLRSGSTTQNGQTFTPSNGTLVINGTATANSALYLKDSTIEGNKIYLPAGTYEVSGFEDYNDANTYVGVNVNSTSGAYTATSKSGNHTFTVEDGDYVFPRARIANGAVMANYILRPMIRRVSDASAFAPYQGTERTIPLGRTVYGGTLDVVHGKLVVDRAGVRIGDKTWAYDATYTRFYATFSDSKIEGTRSQTVLCSAFATHDSGGTIGSVPNNAIYNGGTNRALYIKTNLYTDPTTFKAAFADDLIVYPLDTPLEYDVTPQTIKTLLGVNNVWADAGNMEIEYHIPTENPYPFGSRPLYEITMAGTGTLVVNGKEWTITDYTGTLYCDTEAMEWYDASQLRNNIVSGDGWPVFEAGENSVSYTGDITKVMVTPRWRTL